MFQRGESARGQLISERLATAVCNHVDVFKTYRIGVLKSSYKNRKVERQGWADSAYLGYPILLDLLQPHNSSDPTNIDSKVGRHGLDGLAITHDPFPYKVTCAVAEDSRALEVRVEWKWLVGNLALFRRQVLGLAGRGSAEEASVLPFPLSEQTTGFSELWPARRCREARDDMSLCL